MSLLLPYILSSMVLDSSQMVLIIRKHLLMANIIILDKSYYYNHPKKSIPGDVLALALHLGVFGSGLQADGLGHLKLPLDGQNNHPC